MNYIYVTKSSQLDELKGDIRFWPRIGVDVEANGLDCLTNKVLLIQIGIKEKQYVIDVYRFPDPQRDLQIVWDILADKETLKILHNAKYDYKMLKTNFGIRDITNVLDTWVIESLLTKGKRNKGFSLADLSERYLGVTLDKSTRNDFIDMKPGTLFTDKQIEYAALDVKYLTDILAKQLTKLEKEDMMALARLESETTKVTGDMEINGMFLDSKKWLALEDDAQRRLNEAREELEEHFIDYKIHLQDERWPEELRLDDDITINYNSPKQLLPALNFVLGHDIGSTSVQVISKIDHDVTKALLVYRKAEKQRSTYGEAFLNKNINEFTKRIHSSFNQMRADSGRYSSSDPNLQNIPHETLYRAAFTVQFPDYKMICADYSGCELRLLAELSQEPKWIDALKTGKDLHMMVYADLHGLNYEDVVDENHVPLPQYKAGRVAIKALNFGLMYGMGPRRLAEATGVSYTEARVVMDKFFTTYPKIKQYLDLLVSNARKNGYALSPLDNRKRWLVDFDWDVNKEAAHAGNIARNMPFQGGNASITKLALVYIRNKILENDWDIDNKARIICTIHDEILSEVHEPIADKMKKIQEEEMLHAAYDYVKHVPMAVDCIISTCWVK